MTVSKREVRGARNGRAEDVAGRMGMLETVVEARFGHDPSLARAAYADA